MVVNDDTSRLEWALDYWCTGDCSTSDNEKISSIVSGEEASDNTTRVNVGCVLSRLKAVRGYISADEKLCDGLAMFLKRGLIVVKYLVFISLIANAGFLVSAATNPKGDIIMSVKVPEQVVLGSTANLTCKWDLIGDKSLYSVKWYKDDHEFFRYMPGSQETIQIFPQTGVKLDERASRESLSLIRLIKLTLNSTGQYKCEVSTEGPSFATDFKIGNLSIIKLPDRPPQITGLSTHYAVGENVTANCTAWPSIPKATLQWTINGKNVSREYTVVYSALAPEGSLGTGNSLGLRLEAETRHFDGGEGAVTIGCVSYVGSTPLITKKTVHMAHVNNQRLSAGDSRGGASDKMRGSQQQHLVAVVALVVVGLYVAT